MSKYTFLFFLLFFWWGIAFAQSETEVTVDTSVQVVEAPVPDEEYEEDIEEVVVVDTFLYANTTFVSPDTINGIRKNKKLTYLNSLDSLLKEHQKKKEKEQSQSSNNTIQRSSKNGTSFMERLLGAGIFQTILWILAVCFVLVIIYQLLKGNGLFQKKSAGSEIAEVKDEEEELMQQDNFDLLIEKAIAEKNYRLAVRYHFIKTLQTLWNRNHIQYETDKTNSRYVYEVPQQLRNEFSKLIFQYEYVWYGHFEINEDQYAKVKEGFNEFHKKI